MRENKSNRCAITKKDLRRYIQAMHLAAQSKCRFKIGAVLYRGKVRISAAHNVKKTHPDHCKWEQYVNSIHSEHAALLKAQTHTIGATMYVARFGGKTGTSKPCPMCQAYMRIAGVKYVVYSVNHHIVKETL